MWRLSGYLIKGELVNSGPNRVTGWLQLAGKEEQVTLDLDGGFPNGTQQRIELGNGTPPLCTQLSMGGIPEQEGQAVAIEKGANYLRNFDKHQIGKITHIQLPKRQGIWTRERVGAVIKSMEKSGLFTQKVGPFSAAYIAARKQALEQKARNEEAYYSHSFLLEWNSTSNSGVSLEVFPENVKETET